MGMIFKWLGIFMLVVGFVFINKFGNLPIAIMIIGAVLILEIRDDEN